MDTKAMENYIETLEQVIILLEDNRKITCHGDNIECNQILIDKLHDVYKFIKPSIKPAS